MTRLLSAATEMSVEEPSEKTSLAIHLLAEQAVAERAAVQAGAASIWRRGFLSQLRQGMHLPKDSSPLVLGVVMLKLETSACSAVTHCFS